MTIKRWSEIKHAGEEEKKLREKNERERKKRESK